MSETSTTPPSSTVSPTARDWRKRIVPKTVLGITAVLLAFSIGASLSGVALYSYYEYRLTQSEKRVDGYVNSFDERFRTATETIDAEKQNAQAQIQKELDPLRQFQAEGGTVANLVQQVGPSVWFVETLDESGAPSVGTAFVVESNDKESVVVTSFATVRAATRAPSPEVNVTKGSDRLKARLDNWVEDKDLAVLTIPRGGLKKLEWVAEDQQPRVGERTFVASGLGSSGASVTQGFINDVSAGAITHDSSMGLQFRGGPLLNSDGRVTGVGSTAYSPFGFASPTGTSFATPIRTTCEKLLRCPEGGNSGASPGAR